MPFTFFAHQTIVLPLKRARPRWFDGTALVIGSMAPDFGYPMRGWIQRNSHDFAGMVVWGIPFTIVVTLAIRSWVANTAFAHLPDGGPLRLHSYRALRERWPLWWMTLYSAIIGVGGHILFDSFTHKKSFISQRLGLDQTLFRAPWDSGVSIARTLQYIAHVGGTIGGVLMLITIGRRRLMEQWYGLETIVAARRFKLRRSQRYLFWTITLSGLILGPALATFTRGSVVTKIFVTMALTTAFASSLSACRPRDRALTYFDSLPGDPTPAALNRPDLRSRPAERIERRPVEPRSVEPRSVEPQTAAAPYTLRAAQEPVARQQPIAKQPPDLLEPLEPKPRRVAPPGRADGVIPAPPTRRRRAQPDPEPVVAPRRPKPAPVVSDISSEDDQPKIRRRRAPKPAAPIDTAAQPDPTSPPPKSPGWYD